MDNEVRIGDFVMGMGFTHGCFFCDAPELIHSENREKFLALRPPRRIFKCIDIDGNWIVVGYGEDIFRFDVSQAVRRFSNFDNFETVYIPRKNTIGVIDEIRWHWKRDSCYYHLIIDGKHNKRRYFPDELIKIP